MAFLDLPCRRAPMAVPSLKHSFRRWTTRALGHWLLQTERSGPVRLNSNPRLISGQWAWGGRCRVIHARPTASAPSIAGWMAGGGG